MSSRLYEGALEPIWFGDREVWTVSGVLERARRQIVELPSWWIQGEVSDLRVQSNLSMAYLTLKDPSNGHTVQCVMGRTRFQQLELNLSDGDLVQVYARPDLYAPRGSFQLRLQSVEHTGQGLLMQQLEALKEQLHAEGLFDESRKKRLPFLPRRVGLITGKGAAAEGDFLRNIRRRFDPVCLAVCHTLVQGDNAPPEIIGALRTLDAIHDVDVIVLARGGGAFEDFLAFSDEGVLRTIAACTTPVVSAIGHDKDRPLSDLVADLRVSTPTAAAREVVPDHEQLLATLERQYGSLRRRLADRLARLADREQALATRLRAHAPDRFVGERSQYLDDLALRARRALVGAIGDRRDRATSSHVRMASAWATSYERRTARVTSAAERLRALSPHATMRRGYAIARRQSDGTIIDSITGVEAGMTLDVMVADGTIHSTTTGTTADAR